MIFFGYIVSFFQRLGIFSVSWKEALLILLSLLILILCYMKLLPLRTAAPFAAGMLITNMAEGFSSLPALSPESELTALMVLLYFLGAGAEAEFSWIIRKPSLLLFAIAAQTGFFLILSAPFLFTGNYLTQTNTIPLMIFIYTSLIPVIQEPFTRLTAGQTANHYKDPEPPAPSNGKRISALLIILIITGLLIPAVLPLSGLYLLGSILRFPKFSQLPELVLWFGLGLSSHASVIFTDTVIRIIILGILALILGGLSCGLLCRLISKITSGRLDPSVLRKSVRASSVLGILTGAGVLLTICC